MRCLDKMQQVELNSKFEATRWRTLPEVSRTQTLVIVEEVSRSHFFPAMEQNDAPPSWTHKVHRVTNGWNRKTASTIPQSDQARSKNQRGNMERKKQTSQELSSQLQRTQALENRRVLASQSVFESCVSTGHVDNWAGFELDRTSDIPVRIQSMCSSHKLFYVGGILEQNAGFFMSKPRKTNLNSECSGTRACVGERAFEWFHILA